ncbi:uncharacterized protein LAESUDRAFT_765647 [Laetiporus sulphureus 93-53]|uniref:Uncharacterized protein n=1 Tax=Laetiporus sulphureus 93-53 TaxID=1314785 RepID=A0A165ANJ4_9APHY|nr:uncharacterized protein LAESUDRAFT_765647 [Laetiporus sulphureus 93-53]KZS99352.1 hypothetical protein LAESUDRAFT_765647 [Laetiporus sulphureus 93-53]
MIKDFDFQHGDLVLVQHTQIEKALNRKMRLHYIGPYIVLFHNRGGAYVLSRKKITIAEEMLDASETRLKEMHQSDDQEEEESDGKQEDEESGDEDEGPQNQYDANELEKASIGIRTNYSIIYKQGLS